MSRRRLHPMLVNGIIAAVVTAGVIGAELFALRYDVGFLRPWGARGILISIPVRFVCYLIGYSLIHGRRKTRPPLEQQLSGGIICALTTVPWFVLEIAREALASIGSS
ncbi:MAG: hypothetical protein JXA57_15280 [Armatimonadetes bacterium]|nr:hypothetical protein [Armatimonadota bacterium]